MCHLSPVLYIILYIFGIYLIIDVPMTKKVICPNCGMEIPPTQDEFTTMRVSKEFVDRIKNEQADSTLEDTLRRLLGWSDNKN